MTFSISVAVLLPYTLLSAIGFSPTGDISSRTPRACVYINTPFSQYSSFSAPNLQPIPVRPFLDDTWHRRPHLRRRLQPCITSGGTFRRLNCPHHRLDLCTLLRTSSRTRQRELEASRARYEDGLYSCRLLPSLSLSDLTQAPPGEIPTRGTPKSL